MGDNFDALNIFGDRLKKLGIRVSFAMNFPWVYFRDINDKQVIERFESKHNFTVGFMPIRNDQKFKFTNISEIFKLIRKYV